MNIWNALPWGKGRVSVLADFYSVRSRGLFTCVITFWIDRRHENFVTPFIITSRRQDSLGGASPKIVDGELVIR